MSPPSWDELLEQARRAFGAAHAPYSAFRVGAAVVGESGRIHTGSNVEVSSYGLTICAERLAVFAAVHAGERRLARLALVTDTEAPVTPCGACRQVIQEFGPEAELALATLSGRVRHVGIAELLPDAFDPAVLPHHPGRG